MMQIPNLDQLCAELDRPGDDLVPVDPQVAEGVGATGKNHYFVDSDTNTIHVNPDQPATATDPPIGQ